MTGDHHGATAKRATLLVTATDEILGTLTWLASSGSAWRSGMPATSRSPASRQ